MSPRIVVLVGPKGAGKSSLGRTLARTYGLGHVEPEAIFLGLSRAAFPDGPSFEREGFRRVAAAVGEALVSHPVVVTDTTAASDEAATLFAALAAHGPLVGLRLVASDETCRARVLARSSEGHLPFPAERLAEAFRRSTAATLPFPSATIDVERPLPHPIFLLDHVRSALSSLGVEVRASLPVQTTDRTVLRPWRESDRAPLAALNAAPEVAAHLVSALSAAETDALLVTIGRGIETYGLGPSALEVPGRFPLAGFCGLWVVGFEAPFTPAVEIAWRLAPEAWGHGFVTEAAREVLRRALDDLALPEVVSFTAANNERSRRVMERLGMVRDEAGDFEHPRVPVGHPLRSHVLYRARRA